MLMSEVAIISVEDDKAVLLRASWVVVQPGELICVLKHCNSFPDCC